MKNDHDWLAAAINLSRLCPRSETAFAVGAIVVDVDGRELARGYSREGDAVVHAEESALAKLADTAVDLGGGTIYSSLEPCGERRSRPKTCVELIMAAGLARVVFALREPTRFVEGHGAEILAAAGLVVVELTELSQAVRDVNAHLFEG